MQTFDEKLVTILSDYHKRAIRTPPGHLMSNRPTREAIKRLFLEELAREQVIVKGERGPVLAVPVRAIEELLQEDETF